MWFERLLGFEEGTMDNVRSKLELDGDRLRSKVNGRELKVGKLEIVTLENLRKRTNIEIYSEKLKIEEVVGNVQSMHQDSKNNGAIFQAASQFNLLEMVGPHISPERGVGIYENDYTQGPACAIACGAGTIYRNYFVQVNGQIGQSRENQIDCLDEIGRELENSKLHLWEMNNGYALPSIEGLSLATKLIQSKSSDEYDTLKSKLKVGIQWNTQVTLNGAQNIVSQVYCSALPVAYSGISPQNWEIFARLILEATYEATLCAALVNYESTGNRNVYLTLVGGGAFGNPSQWIFDSMNQAINKFKRAPLELKIVSYGGSSQGVQDFVRRFK
jgi:hypothetical protein